VAIISYNHTQGNVAAITPRLEFYNRPIYPTVIFDGTDEVFEQNPNAYFTTYVEHIIAAKADTPRYNLELTATATANAGNLELKIVTADTIPSGQMIAYVVICEDNIPGMLHFFNYVCQELYMFPVNLVYPDSLDTNIVFNHNIPVDQMTAVVFVQDTTSKKVMHAATKHFEEEE
jgi:hypothetical protein